jgi:hypothetical protein
MLRLSLVGVGQDILTIYTARLGSVRSAYPLGTVLIVSLYSGLRIRSLADIYASLSISSGGRLKGFGG